MSDKETLIREIYRWMAENAPQRVDDMGNLYHSRDVNHMLEGIKRILENHSDTECGLDIIRTSMLLLERRITNLEKEREP
ncbi:hypothetical protein ES703_95536 [subsurface metagenome]